MTEYFAIILLFTFVVSLNDLSPSKKWHDNVMLLAPMQGCVWDRLARYVSATVVLVHHLFNFAVPTAELR